MGFSVRKRTKGKTSWLNVSYSKKGLHASHTMRFGNLTLNFGKKTRVTANLGNGMRYVKTSPSRIKKAAVKFKPYISTNRKTYSSSGNYKAGSEVPEQTWSSENIAMMSAMFWCLIGFIFVYIFSSVIFTVIAINVAHVLTLRWKSTKYPQEKLAYFIPSILMITPIGWIYLLLLLLLV